MVEDIAQLNKNSGGRSRSLLRARDRVGAFVNRTSARLALSRGLNGDLLDGIRRSGRSSRGLRLGRRLATCTGHPLQDELPWLARATTEKERPEVAQAPGVRPALLEVLARINTDLVTVAEHARAGHDDRVGVFLNSYFGTLGAGRGLNGDLLDGIKKLGLEFLAVFRSGR